MADTRVLNERYEVGAPLGTGGMAHVYRGTDRVLERPVAIKVLSGRFAGDDRFVARFRREAQAAAGLSHPNIVGVYDTGDEGRMHYIVMEYVDGETLGDLLRREGRLDPDRAAAIAAEVATALHAAHGSGLVHRDVKPGNVMIDREGRAKVVDFGIARAAADDTLTQTGLVLGTASYLSPEQAQGHAVDARSDIYSLGCVLYEMLTGRPPFDGATPVAIAYRHVNERPLRPRDHDPAIPPHLDQTVMRALEKDPDDRFPTAEAFRATIAAGPPAEVAVPIAARDTDLLPATGPAEPTAPVGRRTPVWVPVALLAAAVLAGIGVIAAGERQRGERPAAAGEERSPAEASPPPHASVGAALGALEDVVIEAVEGEQLSHETGAKILEEAAKAFEEYSKGDLDKALERLGAAHEEVDKAASGDGGSFASPEAAAALHAAIDGVAAAMQASPPPPPAPEDDDGNGEGRGNGAGFVPPGLEKKGEERGSGDD